MKLLEYLYLGFLFLLLIAPFVLTAYDEWKQRQRAGKKQWQAEHPEK